MEPRQYDYEHGNALDYIESRNQPVIAGPNHGEWTPECVAIRAFEQANHELLKGEVPDDTIEKIMARIWDTIEREKE